ncbi:MAG: isocitrate/isopropylmalate family dehydrogenase [Myxococcota bacterium]
MSTSYGVVVLPGDGVGVEVANEAKKILAVVEKRAGVKFDLTEIPCGGRYYLEHGETRDWPEGAEEKCAAADVILLGAVGWPSPNKTGPVTMKDGKMAGYSAVIGNRVRLDLYANVRPVKLYPGVEHKISGKLKQVWEPKDVDMVFLRENTEGLYSGSGGILAPGGVSTVATDTRVITRTASERIIKLAFETAQARSGAPGDKKKRVTCIVKNNVLYGCKLFAEIFEEIGRGYPGIERELAIVDAMTQWLVLQPEHYDVVVATNMFGDILTDLAAVLQGGMGMAVGCNVGDKHGMFEPIHGSAPTLKPGQANPMAMILATGEALRWLGKRKAAPALVTAGDSVERAVRTVLEQRGPMTADLVGPEKAAKTSEVTDAIVAEMSR